MSIAIPLRIHDLKTPLKWTYTIDTDGKIVNLDTGAEIRGTSITKNNRYKKVHLDKFRPLHRLVAEHFIPNPLKLPQVNHIDGDRNNNAVSNLEWVSARANVLHAYRTQLKTNAGEVNPNAKLTEQDVLAIRELAEAGRTDRQIRDSLQLPVVIGTVKAVRQRKVWQHI